MSWISRLFNNAQVCPAHIATPGRISHSALCPVHTARPVAARRTVRAVYHLLNTSLESGSARGVRRILVRGSMPPCRLRRRKFRKFDYEMVHSEVYLNKCVVSIAPFSTPACPDCAQNIQKTALFCMFSLFHFSSIFPGGQLTPFVPMCGRLWGQRVVGPGRVAAVERLVLSVFTYSEHIKTSNSVGGSLESSRPPDPTRLFCRVASRRAERCESDITCYRSYLSVCRHIGVLSVRVTCRCKGHVTSCCCCCC